MRKITVVLLCLTLISALLFGCGSGNQSGETAGENVSTENKSEGSNDFEAMAQGLLSAEMYEYVKVFAAEEEVSFDKAFGMVAKKMGYKSAEQWLGALEEEKAAADEKETSQATAETTGRDVTVGKWVMNVFDNFFYDCYFYYEDGELVKVEIRFSKGGGGEDLEVMIYEGDNLPSCEYYGKTPEQIREMMKSYGADNHNWKRWE